MSERPDPPPADEEEEPWWAEAVDRELWHVNPDGSGHDKYPPYEAFGPGTMPYRGGRGDEELEGEDEEP